MLARKDFYNRWVKEDVHRALFASFQTEAQELLEKYLDEVEASLDKREVEDPITGESRPPDERFLRSVEEKIKISESGKLSFRQEVVRKAMVAFKAGEKFTLDNHSRLHEAIEQYLFEERRDVLRLVTSRARPDEDAEQKISAVQERLIREYGYDAHSAKEALELRNDVAVSGIGSRTREGERGGMENGSRVHRAPGARPAMVRPVLARRARLAPAQRQSARSAVREKLPDLIARQRRLAARGQHRAGARAFSRALALPPSRSGARRRRRPRRRQARRHARAARRSARAWQGRRRQRRGRLPVRAGAQDRRHRRLALGRAQAAESQGEERRDAQRGLHARRLEPPRRALAARPATLVEGSDQAPRRATGRTRRSRTTICVTGSSRCASARRPKRSCSSRWTCRRA